ncbi:histone acetyltransferase KAT2A-like [Acyrthosiphon pisum]|uniref:PCAF N-terminal domain-containing protein n=1 Tax=Acyrthosiphon pisum TaxID=7029 RepID=A0A8R2A8P0_ACYPI|nr:histone acetyltransferase KAT2A-like [Acyrthosiphon pisum]|eukprot:XP_003244523.1 PREDICTED: histone acetyltransferase KAT2A-like [Acyrthosiphon pisum]
MGGLLCCISFWRNQRQDHNYRQSPPDDKLVMHRWTLNDLLFVHVKSRRLILQNRDMGYLQAIIAKFSTCKCPGCKCQGGIFTGIKRDNFGWINSICTRSGCKHRLSDHIQHLREASFKEFTVLMKLIFDIYNTDITLYNLSKKPKSERNILLKGIFESVFDVLDASVLLDPFTLPNIDTIYGSPPFEKTNIEQVLLNFCMHIFNDNGTLKFEDALKVTKFVLKYFDTWMWNIPQELLKCDPREYSKSYDYYYCRFLLHCCLPRCVHSISLRYRPTKIFGQDVLKYTLKAFRIQLQVWCCKKSIMWNELTTSFCLDYFPKYMDLLEKEVFNDESPIWDMDYEHGDLKRETIFLEY